MLAWSQSSHGRPYGHTLQTFDNARVAQHPFDLGRADRRLEHPDQPPSLKAQGAWSMACLTGRICSQITGTSRFVACSQGLGLAAATVRVLRGSIRVGECLNGSGNLNWAQA